MMCVKPNDAFLSDLSPAFLDTMQKGVLRTQYRQIPMYKSPFDLVLYLQLIARLRPATVIELGSSSGGSALWFADMLSLHGIDPRIISIDREMMTRFNDPRIVFVKGDVMHLGEVLTDSFLEKLPRPWLVVEDSAHFYETCLAALRFFDRHLASGEYIVVEDGVVAALPQDRYGHYLDGPNRAVAQFLAEQGGRYAVDLDLCHFYGRNVTYNPNGWLRKVAI